MRARLLNIKIDPLSGFHLEFALFSRLTVCALHLNSERRDHQHEEGPHVKMLSSGFVYRFQFSLIFFFRSLLKKKDKLSSGIEA